MVLKRVLASMLALATIGAGELGAQGGGRGGRGSAPDSVRLDSVRSRVVHLVARLDSTARNARLMLYGFALECTQCSQWRIGWDSGFRRVRGDTVEIVRMPLYTYTVWPRVAALAPGGTAERAGVLVGDSLVAVNGESILSPEGTRKLSIVHTGDDVTLTLRRGGRNVDVTMTLTGMPPWGGERGTGARAGGGGGRARGGSGAAPADTLALPLRFAGKLGATPVEVMSDAPLTVVMEAAGDLVIHVAGSTVRLHPTAPGSGRGGRSGAERKP